MKRRYVTADVFTDQPFQGNPVAVVLDAQGLSTAQMLAVAAEFGYSETTFVLRARSTENTAWVRIFTPNREVPFAGQGWVAFDPTPDQTSKAPQPNPKQQAAPKPQVVQPPPPPPPPGQAKTSDVDQSKSDPDDPDEPGSQGIDQQDGPPGIPRFVGTLADLLQGHVHRRDFRHPCFESAMATDPDHSETLLVTAFSAAATRNPLPVVMLISFNWFATSRVHTDDGRMTFSHRKGAFALAL